MIGIKLPPLRIDCPNYWQNFIVGFDKTYNETQNKKWNIISDMLLPYKATLIVHMKDGTSHNLCEQDYQNTSDIDYPFLSFVSEADMLYFVMEWS